VVEYGEWGEWGRNLKKLGKVQAYIWFEKEF
jgi:hypothetical protein